MCPVYSVNDVTGLYLSQPSPKGRGSQSGLGRERVGIIHRALARYQEPRVKSSTHRSCQEFLTDCGLKPAAKSCGWSLRLGPLPALSQRERESIGTTT